jgi:nitroreductase
MGSCKPANPFFASKELDMSLSDHRKPDHAIDALFYERWSCRSFTADEIGDEQLLTLFEAARWAPSASNTQPWRFLYSKRGDAHWSTYVSLLVEGNRVWADKAAALVFVLSAETSEHNGKVSPAPNHSFDAGAAWMSFALQAHLNGWSTHAMAGIDKPAIPNALGIPAGYTIEVAIAIGHAGPVNVLPEQLRARELPNGRRPLAETVAAGKFAW